MESTIAQTNSPPAVSIRGVSKRYRRGVWALRDVSLELPYGTITALVGPNGAGKTTLIRICVGFEPPTLGHIAIGSQPVDRRGNAAKAIGYVAQHPSFYERLTVGDHLELGHHYRAGFDQSSAAERMVALGIPLGARARELSGGQQAQLALVLATSSRADVLLLDEPLASLDPLARREFLNVLLETVRASRAAVLLSSHMLADVEGVADRLVVLRAGKVRYDASVALARAAHAVVDEEDVALAANNPVGRFASLNGGWLYLIATSPGTDAPGRPATLEEVAMGYLAGN